MTSKAVEGKIALITGGNKGIGLEIARQLGEQGITVLLGVRDESRGREAAEKLQAERIDAHAVQLDVTNQDTIDAAANHIESEFGKLDILVNNAGIAVDNASPSQLDIEVLRRTYDTNFFGVFALTKAMLPLLRKSEAGRIVNMSSGLGSLAQNTDPNYEYAQAKYLAYNSSKTALNAMTIQFAYELKDTPIKINSADPGSVATDLNVHGPRTVQQGATAAVRLATLPADGPTGSFFDENGVVPW
jgi:NAD(P)-dependent dehydrogenase (short-subunit alcohol dehydrogenase family)